MRRFDPYPYRQGPQDRLKPVIDRFYIDGPGGHDLSFQLIYLRQLELAAQEEVDRFVVMLREEGSAFTQIATLAAGQNGRPEPWQDRRRRYRDAVKRLRGPDEEVLGLKELQRRRAEIAKFEAVLEIGPRPEVKRSRDNAPRFSVPARELRRGDLIGLIHPKAVVSAKTYIREDGSSYIDVLLHDSTSRGYDRDEQVSFGHENDLKD